MLCATLFDELAALQLETRWQKRCCEERSATSSDEEAPGDSCFDVLPSHAATLKEHAFDNVLPNLLGVIDLHASHAGMRPKAV